MEPTELTSKDRVQLESNTGSLNAQLSKLILGPSYISNLEGTTIQGNHGHASIMLKRPIVEDNYFMEFIVKKDAKHDKFTFYPSAVRVGICSSSF